MQYQHSLASIGLGVQLLSSSSLLATLGLLTLSLLRSGEKGTPLLVESQTTRKDLGVFPSHRPGFLNLSFLCRLRRKASIPG